MVGVVVVVVYRASQHTIEPLYSKDRASLKVSIHGEAWRRPEIIRFAVFAEIVWYASDDHKGRCTVVVGMRDEEEEEEVDVVVVVVVAAKTCRTAATWVASASRNPSPS